jgi:hypothetical protein
MNDFLMFRKMVTPILVQIVFWVAVIGAILTGLYYLVSDEYLMGLAIIILGPFVARVSAEMLLVTFKIHEAVADIKNNTERQ